MRYFFERSCRSLFIEHNFYCMLEIKKASKLPADTRRIKIVGVGNAGTSLIDRVTVERTTAQWETIAINTDLQSLAYSIADSKMPIGTKVTRGLGTGSYPKLGREAALESQTIIQAIARSTTMIIACAGLGGGTGSGALPILLETVRAHGVLTVALLTLPFNFEGERRIQHARDALATIRSSTDAIFVLDNNRVSEVSQPKANLGEAFAQSGALLLQACTTIAKIVFGTGPMQTTPGDLAFILRPDSDGISIFGFGESEGSNRAYDAIGCAINNPMAHGHILASAERLLVHIDGPSNLLLSEVEVIVQEVLKSCNATRILLGVQAARLSSSVPPVVTVSLLGTTGRSIVSTDRLLPPLHNISVTPLVPLFVSQKPSCISTTEAEAMSSQDTHLKTLPSSSSTADTWTLQSNEKEYKNSTQPEWKQLPLSPTLHAGLKQTVSVEGEDIDIPTFLRMKIKLK